MSTPPRLAPLCDPISLGKLQVLLVPVPVGPDPLPEATYHHWTSLFRRHASLRADELRQRPPSASTSSSSSSHSRGGGAEHSRSRFLPSSTSTSVSRANTNNHVHLSFPSHPPARHLYPLSLLRLSLFPLIVIGIGIAPEGEGEAEGYTLGASSVDLGEVSTPTAPTFGKEVTDRPPVTPTGAFERALKELFPPTSPFPLVRRLVLVPQHLPRSSSPIPSPIRSPGPKPPAFGTGSDKDNGDVRYGPAEGAEAWVTKLLGEVVGDVFGELGELATALETPQGLKTLSATLLPSLTSTLPDPNVSDMFPSSSTPTDITRPRSSTPTGLPHSQSFDRLGSAGMGITLTRALTPGGRPTSVQAPSLPPVTPSAISPAPAPVPIATSSNPFRRSTAISSPFSRTSSAASLPSAGSPSPAPQVAVKYTSATLTGVAGGRLMKVLGDIYLLIGLHGDAIKCYEDGAERSRVVGDVLWEAAAREGRAAAGVGEAWEARDGSDRSQPFSNSPIPVEILAHYLSALACLSRAPLPYPPTILSPSPMAASGSLVIPNASVTHAVPVGTGEGFLAYLYTGLSLRISHFLLIIWSAGGWGSIALSSLMSHSLPRSFPLPLDTAAESEKNGHTGQRRRRYLSLLSSRSGLTRHSVFAHTAGALGPHHRAMTKPEQLAVHVEAIWLARWLDLPRHEAGITREVVKRIGVMIVEGREETRRRLASGFSHQVHGAHGSMDADAAAASVGLGLGMTVGSAHSVAVRRRESTEGNDAVIRLFERACTIMGVNLLSLPDSHSASTSTSVTGSIEPEVRPPRFGWPELQVEMIKEGIAVAESLPDPTAVIRLCLSALRSLHPYLNATSQGHLAKMYPQALATVRRRGMIFGAVPWWVPGKVVLSVEIASLATNRLPVEHSAAEIAPGKKDPFLYNPRLKPAEAGTTVLVANEQVDVFVTLSNPFTFDLELADLSLVTTGVPFVTSPLPLILPATSVQTVRVSGVASSAGALQIRGVSARLVDGATTEVLLPVMDDAAKQRTEKRRFRVAAETAKIKRIGLDARFPPAVEPQRDSGVPEDRWLECKVVDEQPLVWIKKTNLTHGTVMLYNGETSTIKITLENSSAVPVDFIKLSFDDSTAREAQALVAEGELSPEQAYELDWDTVNQPVFSWDQTKEVSIPPGGRSTLSVRCLGKVGCTDGSIRIDYGYVTRGDTDVKSFHTRQITFPVLFTVYHTLEVNQLDLARLVGPPATAHAQLPNGDDAHGLAVNNGKLSVPPSAATSRPTTPRRGSFVLGEDSLRQKLQEESDGRHCLVSIGVRNVYGVPFEVTLTRNNDDGPLVVSRLVPPGATERIIIPLSRLSLPKNVLGKPIPSLTDRQYVVDKNKRSVHQVKAERELFWYREELLKRITATWVEPGSLRGGSLSLREQTLSSDMLDVLREDEVEVRLAVSSRDGGDVRATEFVNVEVEVVNHLERPLVPRIRLEPLSPDSWTSPSPNPRRNIPSFPRHIVFDGILTTTLPSLSPDTSASHVVGAMFLAQGEFAFRAVVDDLQSQSQDPDPTSEGERVGKVYFSPLLHVHVK